MSNGSGLLLTLQDILSMCGKTSYERGKTFYLANQVTRLNYDPEMRSYQATVRGSHLYNVEIALDEDDDIEAECDCPAYDSYYTYCKHIAAVLIYIHEKGATSLAQKPLLATAKPAPLQVIPAAPPIPHRDQQLSKTIMAIFDAPLFSDDPRPILSRDVMQPLSVEFICHAVQAYAEPARFAIEMKVGISRLYVIQKIKDFFENLDRQLPISFSKLFTLDLSVQIFNEADGAVVRHLQEIWRSEKAYLQSFRNYYSSYGSNQDRMLFIPPLSWESLLPLLLKADKVTFMHNAQSYNRFELAEGKVNLAFRIGKEGTEAFKLEIRGLQQLIVLEDYGYVAMGNRLYRLNAAQSRRFAELKRMFSHDRNHQLLLSPADLELFLEKAIPGLRQIGTLEMDQDISRRLVNAPLIAKLYLDRDGETLLARLEFVYGDIVIEPLRAEGARFQDATDRIAIRDVENEQRIMRELARAPFHKRDGQLQMDDEASVYAFIYEQIPVLEQWAEVYATPAVRSLQHKSFSQPRASVEVDSDMDWLEVGFSMEGIGEEEIRGILRSLVEKRKYYRLASGAFLSLEDDGFKEIGEMLQGIGVRKTDIKGEQLRLPVVRGFHLLDGEEQSRNVKLGKSLRQLLDNLKHPDNLEFVLPLELNSVLRDYQKFGFQWMKTLAHYRFGGILADDMGLGKTLQGIAFILSEHQASLASKNGSFRRSKRTGGRALHPLPALIVSPASLIYNWKNELAKFAPGLKAVVAAGTKSERDEILKEAVSADVLITSYPLLRRDLEWYGDRYFRIMILDEAQAIKNHNTQTAQAVKELKTGQRFALTGTPVENTLEELWSIYDAVFPELFAGKKAFQNLSREQVAKKVRPFLLRRLKSEVLKELPDKIETLQPSELSADQKKLYVAYLARLREETLEQLQAEGFQKSRMKILAGLTRLRQLCCHPALFVEDYKGASGKLEQLMEIVEECLGSNKRMLIFSQFTTMLDIIREKLNQGGIASFYLDGSTPSIERVELCRRFNEGERDIFLISLKAGGTGLNLTGADTVILYDLWWNPAVEQQAADRAHRIGQKNVVQVIRLVTQGTIEEKMYELQQRKKDLIDEVIQSSGEGITALSEQEIRELLML